MNGFRFKCCDLADQLTSTSSGVLVLGSCYEESMANYYGRLEEVVVLNYPGGHNIVTFKCHWFDNVKGIKVDHNKVVTVDVKSKLRSNEHFVLASQATQVYYASNVVNPKSSWYTVVKTKTRAFVDTSRVEDDDALQEKMSCPTHIEIEDDEVDTLIDFQINKVEGDDGNMNNNASADFVIVEEDNDNPTIEEYQDEEAEDDEEVDPDGFDDIV